MIRTTAKYVSLAFLQITLLASSALAESRFCFDAAMLGGSAEVCADVYENPAAPAGETVLAVHGFTEAALSWTPFVEALFEHSAWKYRVKRFIAIDLPGRGNSPMPAGLPGGVFGELYEEDFIDIIVQGIRALRDDGIGPDILMGHSMGGLAVQGVQEELLSEGSSLASLGVSQAVLLGALPALGATWNQVRFPDFVLDLFTQGAPDGPYGQYIFFPPPVARTGPGFTTLSGALATGTPPVEEIAVGAEPYFCTHQLTANPDFPPRPYAREGAFATEHGTRLMVIAFSQDAFVSPQDEAALYQYLTGIPGAPFFRLIESPEAVHNMYITEPDVVVDALHGF